jgi:hypothetical protein
LKQDVSSEVPKGNSHCGISVHKNEVAKENNNDNTIGDKNGNPLLEDDDSDMPDHKDFKQSTITRDDEQGIWSQGHIFLF